MDLNSRNGEHRTRQPANVAGLHDAGVGADVLVPVLQDGWLHGLITDEGVPIKER